MILQTKNLTVKLKNKTILNNINFETNKGDIVFILGESGTGKTTFLKTLNSLIPISNGKILFKKKDIRDINPIELRKSICYISQVPVSISNTVLNEFKFVKKEISKNEITELLYNFRLDTNILNKDMKTLSIGQQQRVAILRGILNDPEIMLLDEPTSALDELNIEYLENIILSLKKERKMTFIIVTHNISFAKTISQSIFKLKDGTLI